MKKKIKNLVQNSPYKKRILFLGELSNMNSFYDSLDIFLLCSRWEGMSNLLNEVLSYGIPCVSTKVDGCVELLENGRYGILTEINNVEEITQGLKNIINKKVHFVASESINHIKNNFSLEKMITETERIFFPN